MNTTYRSPYEAYPFLADTAADLRCDFELMTDDMASSIGLLRATVEDETIQNDLLKLCELVYHANPTLRTKMTVTDEEVDWLKVKTEELQVLSGSRCQRFVLTQGGQEACQAHVLRVKGKSLVRLLYRYAENGGVVPDTLFDFCNLLSGYFFMLALRLNELEGIDEIDYESRNY